MIHSIWVINKAGGLVFSRSYTDVLPPLPLNAILILAGTLHGIHAITGRLDPTSRSNSARARIAQAGASDGSAAGAGAGAGAVAGQGMEAFEAEGWGGRIYVTPTGTKFIVLHSLPHHGTAMEDIMKRIYEIYADGVMKNPFHTPEMPINSSLFESRLAGYVGTVNA